MAVAHRVYAEALLEAAKEKDRLASVREGFDEFSGALAESDELRGFLRNPQIETETKVAALDELLAGGEELFANFLRLLAEKGRIAEVDRSGGAGARRARAAARPGGRADPVGGADRAAGRIRPHQPRRRRCADRQPQDGRGSPRPRLPQARHPLARRARRPHAGAAHRVQKIGKHPTQGPPAGVYVVTR